MSDERTAIATYHQLVLAQEAVAALGAAGIPGAIVPTGLIGSSALVPLGQGFLQVIVPTEHASAAREVLEGVAIDLEAGPPDE